MAKNESEIQPSVAVIESVPSLPRLIRDGPGAFTDLFASISTSSKPVVCGVWTADDTEEENQAYDQPYDEMKYVLTGDSVWENVRSGQRFNASSGSMIWLPKGAETRLVSSKNLTAVYIEQTYRDPVPPAQLSTNWLTRLDTLYEKAVQDYVENNPLSKSHYEKASRYLPGGNTRPVLSCAPFPLGLASGHGCHVTSLDGVEYLDLVSEYSAAFFGHSNNQILAAIQRTSQKGLNLGGISSDEAELAEQLVNRFSSIDKIRFCNSGTEANILAISLGLFHTNRKQVLGFANGYHGGFTHFGSAGKGLNLPFDYVIGQFNETITNETLLTEQIGVIIVEPMQGAGGMNLATKEFLQWVRKAATKIGAVLIFDEIITSRLHMGGLQTHFEVYPDLTTLGKYVGGGFGFGACGGSEDVMMSLSIGRLFHSGTYNNDTFTMAAGVAAGKLLSADKIASANALGDKLRDGINLLATACPEKHLIRSTGYGSCIGVHFGGPVPNRLRDTFFFFLLQHKIYIGKRGFLSVNLEHVEEDVTYVLKVIERFFQVVWS